MVVKMAPVNALGMVKMGSNASGKGLENGLISSLRVLVRPVPFYIFGYMTSFFGKQGPISASMTVG